MQDVERRMAVRTVDRAVSSRHKVAAAALLAAALSSPVHALPQESMKSESGRAGVSGSFLQTYSFRPGVISGNDHLATRVDLPPSFWTGSFTAKLLAGSSSVPIVPAVEGSLAGGQISNSFFLGPRTASEYWIHTGGTFARTTSGAVRYLGPQQVAAHPDPVPEPEIWAMILVGVGLVVIRLRQKSRLASTQHFA